MTNIPITIIGGGAVGRAIAYKLSENYKDNLVVLDKNPRNLISNQSTRNSGVIHAGIYYDKQLEPLKAKFCVEGNQMMYDFAKNFDVTHKDTGKLVVAKTDNDVESLEDVLRMAKENNVPNVEMISGEKAKEMEPNVDCKAALYVPTSGIIDAGEYIAKLGQLIEKNGSFILPETEVIAIKPKGEGFEVTTKSQGRIETYETNIIINSAGLYSDDVARMIDPSSPYDIYPIRGESMKFYATKPGIEMNGMNIYPAPYGVFPNGEKLDASFAELQKMIKEGKVMKTVGVHLTPMFDYQNGNVIVGKTVLVGPAFKGGVEKEDYKQGFGEEHYTSLVQSYFPNMKDEHLSPLQTGIRAKLKGHRDFVIERSEKHTNAINLIGIDSPGLTSSLAIAEYINEMVK